MHILETKDLSHDFKGLKALSNVSLQIAEGERHAVIGPNGAGKTTLFNIINGTYIPKAGKVFFKERDVTSARPFELARMGIGRSFQITSTFSKLTVFQNIRLGILSKKGIRFNLFHRVDKMDAVTQEANELLKRIHLFEERDVPAGELSYGKHRSLEVGMAVAADPALVMLDEPTAGMSRDETHHAIDLIQNITEGRTVVIIEHDMDVVFSIADRITVLHLGEVLAAGKPSDVRSNAQVKEAYLGETE